VEPVADIAARARRAVAVFGAERVLLTPDCGFATFADNPVTGVTAAEGKLRAVVEAAALVRQG
jgi:5-methyltetrahydropteroyltriglutamate--homocysteine methyltransferase